MWDFLAGNVALGLMLGITVAAFGWWQREAFREMVNAPETAWRAIAWGAIALVAALVLWGTFADDWRKMFGELLDLREQYASQRTVKNPVAGELRAVTLALLTPALLLSGALFARYLGGYGLQAVLLIVGFSSFFVLYLFRQRLDAGLVGIVLNAPQGFTAATFASLFYILIDYAANIGLILMSYLTLVGIAAIPVTAILDLLGHRDPPARPSSNDVDFYARIRTGVAERQAEAERLRAAGNE